LTGRALSCSKLCGDNLPEVSAAWLRRSRLVYRSNSVMAVVTAAMGFSSLAHRRQLMPSRKRIAAEKSHPNRPVLDA